MNTSARGKLSSKLTWLIKKFDIRPEDLAEQVDLSPSYVRRLINGAHDNPTMEVIEKLSAHFKVRPAFFFSLEDDIESTYAYRVEAIQDYLKIKGRTSEHTLMIELARRLDASPTAREIGVKAIQLGKDSPARKLYQKLNITILDILLEEIGKDGHFT